MGKKNRPKCVSRSFDRAFRQMCSENAIALFLQPQWLNEGFSIGSHSSIGLGGNSVESGTWDRNCSTGSLSSPTSLSKPCFLPFRSCTGSLGSARCATRFSNTHPDLLMAKLIWIIFQRRSLRGMRSAVCEGSKRVNTARKTRKLRILSTDVEFLGIRHDKRDLRPGTAFGQV